MTSMLGIFVQAAADGRQATEASKDRAFIFSDLCDTGELPLQDALTPTWFKQRRFVSFWLMRQRLWPGSHYPFLRTVCVHLYENNERVMYPGLSLAVPRIGRHPSFCVILPLPSCGSSVGARAACSVTRMTPVARAARERELRR